MKEEKKVVHEGEDENDKDKKIYYDISMEENIGNHGYIGTSILRIYRIYWRYIDGYSGKKYW